MDFTTFLCHSICSIKSFYIIFGVYFRIFSGLDTFWSTVEFIKLNGALRGEN